MIPGGKPDRGKEPIRSSPQSEFVLVAAAQTTGSEGIAQRELESPRPARTEEPACRAQRLVEAGRGNVVVKSGVIIVVEAPDVGDVEEVENLADALEFLLVEHREGLGYAQVQRIEIASELQARSHMRQRSPGVAGRLVRTSACRQRVPDINRRVQLSAVGNLPPQCIAWQDGQPRVESRNKRIHRQMRSDRPDG